ncbi:MAG: phenylalanine--tRNA ligase subunit beta [Oligoflexales bacterium]
MLVSLNWLNEYCDFSDLSPEIIAETLTQLGHEVEGSETIAPIPKGVIVGQIKTAAKHPGADSLQLCDVDVGAGELLKIVCGAPNARSGLKVAVATVGTQLAPDFKIKASKIRGEPSQGMLCSEKELSISEANEGILEITADWKLGSPIADYVNTDDIILDISLTPNRADCLSYVGLARDLAAKLGRTLRLPDIKCGSGEFQTSEKVKVKIAADAGCARFTALAIEGVKSVAAPTWMQTRLKAAGMRPINLLVDVTNYVMLELGQPIHAYDKRYLEGGVIEVRSATLGETLSTLDGNTVELDPGDLLICDSTKSVGLAGIMGGANSEVKSDTSDLIIEVAHFFPTQVRKTSKRLGLHTEASHRFERGIHIENIDQVSLRVGTLLERCLLEVGEQAPQVSCKLLDVYPAPQTPAKIALRLPRVRSFLNLHQLSLDDCVKHLSALQFKLIDKTTERMLFEIPGFRHDIVREVDLIEEVARLEGFEKVPYELPRMNITPNIEHPIIEFTDSVKLVLAQLGLTEAISFPFHSVHDYEKLRLKIGHPYWPTKELLNPLNEEMAFMQTSLIPGLLKASRLNRHHGHKGSRLFEVGRAFYDFGAVTLDKKQYPLFSDWDRDELHLTAKAHGEKSRPIERNLVAGIFDHLYREQGWDHAEEQAHFFHGKGVVEALCASFGLYCLEWHRPSESELPFMHPGACAKIISGSHVLGFVGELHPSSALDWELGGESPVVFELDLEALYMAQDQKQDVDPRPRKFPAVIRDFALVVDEGLSYANLEKAVNEFPKKKNLKRMRLFDLYQGEHVESGKKSMAASFVFESLEKTLTDKEVEKESQNLLQWLKQRVGSELR